MAVTDCTPRFPLPVDTLVRAARGAHSVVKPADALPSMEALAAFGPDFGLTTKLRLGHFLAQATVETAYWRTREEYASGWDYDPSRNPKKARALGNTRKGDGPRYKGHGDLQNTGKTNHRIVTDELREMYPGGVLWQGRLLPVPDFVDDPKALTRAPWSTLGGLVWWKRNGGNAEADRGDSAAVVARVSRGVNRGNYASPHRAYAEDERTEAFRGVMAVLHASGIA